MAVPTVAFSLAVVRNSRTGRYCMVHEKQTRGWWLPGGGVDAGQTLDEAALRETEEEAGISARLTGVLRFEIGHEGAKSGRLRVIYAAEPVDDGQTPKTVADGHSRGARWVTTHEMDAIAAKALLKEVGKPCIPQDELGCSVIARTQYLRGGEPRWFSYLEAGGSAAPMSLLTSEIVGERPEQPDDDPPRAFYPTVWFVRMAVRKGDAVMADRGPHGYALPGQVVAGGSDPHATADALASKLSAEVAGMLRISHVIDLSGSPQEHKAIVTVTYAATPRSDGSGEGYVPVSEMGKLAAVLQLTPQRLGFLDFETSPVPSE
eukprot:TRINITY_DN3687_c0_g1_i1.p1 TRINITY_DN3687_c0_g1~~TRINITY_DN3687_c0_g1_i1.p1  ORF type:complete len:348 (+),score=97.43 TRINITY_DN3687_c0_g1_i1:88-1044(+)